MKFIIIVDKEDIGCCKCSFEKKMENIAAFCHKNDIDVTPETVLTSFEYSKKFLTDKNIGCKHVEAQIDKEEAFKIESYGWISKDDTGPFIRSKIRYYIEYKSENLTK